MIEGSVLDVLVGRAVGELARVSEAMPDLAARCSRAADILDRHFADPRAGVIRGQLRGGGLAGYLVRGSGGAVYRVEASGSWRCSCPDHHGRHRRRGDSKACKHGLAVWALWRASARLANWAEVRIEALTRCMGCGVEAARSELVEVREEGHDGLMHQDGDRLCVGCCDRTAVLR